MRFHKFLLTATFTLIGTTTYGLPSAPLSTIESVKSLAKYRTTIDHCLVSADFRNLADTTKRQTVAISNKIDRLANDLHESARGKLLFFTYNLTLSRLAKSVELRQQLVQRRGGVCDFNMFLNMDSELKNIERLINKQL